MEGLTHDDRLRERCHWQWYVAFSARVIEI